MNGPSAHARRQVVLAYLRLPHAVPLLCVLAATVALAVVIADGSPPVGRLALMVLAMLGGQLVVGVANELVDVESDAVTKPGKPIPSGLVDPRGAEVVLVAGLLLLLVAGAGLGGRELALCAIGNGIGVAYSLWFKRTHLAWVPYLLAVPLLPIWVAVCLGAYTAGLLAIFPLGALAALALYLAQSAPDVVSDADAGLRTLPTKLGERGTLMVCWLAMSLATAVALIAVSEAGESAAWVALLGLAPIGGDILVYVHNSRRGLLLAFPACALATSLLGLLFVAATTG